MSAKMLYVTTLKLNTSSMFLVLSTWHSHSHTTALTDKVDKSTDVLFMSPAVHYCHF